MNLVAKEVEFNGDILRAAQDTEGNVWVGARWVCEAIGLDDNRIKYERRKMQTDSVISKGVQNFTLLTNGGNQNVLCLQLDYLPLWLAKISITPAMRKESPGITEKLVSYQLKAKDVLAAAFLEKKVDSPNVIQLQMPDFSKQIEVLQEKVDRVYADMGKVVSVLLESKAPAVALPVKKVEDPCKKWKNDMYQMIDALTTCDRFSDRGSVMGAVYKYMNKNYGICWDQEVKDYKAKHNPVSKFSTYDVVYANDTLRSIFSAALGDLYEKYKPVCNQDATDSIVIPLVEKYKDKSNGSMVTYRKVYQKMKEMNSSINWHNLETRYANKHGKGRVTRKKIVCANPELLKKFKNAVDVLLIE